MYFNVVSFYSSQSPVLLK